MELDHLDHLVLTVRDIDTTCTFYQTALGMRRAQFGAGRTALQFGNQKLNLHPAQNAIELKALAPTPGSADLCFIARTPLAEVIAHLAKVGVVVLEGPTPRTGALGPIESVYFRDPDGNLIEVSNYVAKL